jgi:hypothetical protein
LLLLLLLVVDTDVLGAHGYHVLEEVLVASAANARWPGEIGCGVQFGRNAAGGGIGRGAVLAPHEVRHGRRDGHGAVDHRLGVATGTSDTDTPARKKKFMVKKMSFLE